MPKRDDSHRTQEGGVLGDNDSKQTALYTKADSYMWDLSFPLNIIKEEPQNEVSERLEFTKDKVCR